MKVQIVNIRDEHYVEFLSGPGTGIAFCKKIEKVKKGMEYGAELDIDPPIRLNQNAVLVSDRRYFIRFSEDKNEIQGVIESIDEERYGCIRLAVDCIILIEILSDEIKEGDYLLLTVDRNDLRIALM